jgi:hypothetical protein
METGRQGDKEILWHSEPVSLPTPLVVSLSFVCGVAAAVALGWLAAKLNVAGFAPVGLLPLAIGIALGGMVGRFATAAGIVSTKRLILTAVLLAIVVVLTEHAWLYRDFCRQWREARTNQAQVAMFRAETPWSPSEYFANEATPGRVALWCIDAALIVVAAVATVWMSRHLLANHADP